MTALDEREKALEAAFVHGEEVRFLMLSHRNRLFGQWAADLLHYRGEMAEHYIGSIVAMTGKPPHGLPTPDDAIVSHVANDLRNAGLTITDADARRPLSRFEEEAKAAFRADRS